MSALLIVGGIIPDEDIAGLKQAGVAEVFQPGASTQDIVSFIRTRVPTSAGGEKTLNPETSGDRLCPRELCSNSLVVLLLQSPGFPCRMPAPIRHANA